MLRLVAGAMLALVLAACGQQVTTSEEAATTEAYGGMDADVAQRAAAPPAAPAPADPSSGEQQASPGEPPPQGGGTTSPILYLAYSYAMGLEIPSQRLAGVVDAHVQACQSAGPRLCQLIGSNKSGDPDAYMTGYVQMRGEPQWLRNFMSGMSAQVDEAGGRIVEQTTNTEDLTRQIVDTEARLRALTALRNRLQELLRSRPGRLADLLEVERELARVQGEIDAIQSNLAVMRTRVSMSELAINYRSAPRPVGSNTFEPLQRALADFLGVIVAGFAALIYLIAGLIPIAVIAVPLIWLALRWRKRRGGRIFRRNPPVETPPPSTSSG
ncbi:MAG TPA: DUF4349 domain-containing protein [Vitreimonas sp.]|uniref:DUF4349 domain-containing protein n=1 Tax=Vitreimonas sp. TaxID=3069702 RepID=UPI002D35CFE5|nr:DUF4349 domain-containing protein [Vitreimonas sp.]HYD88456.1 DUF4349 domain-containing protein [Vitreimonas sp.]